MAIVHGGILRMVLDPSIDIIYRGGPQAIRKPSLQLQCGRRDCHNW